MILLTSCSKILTKVKRVNTKEAKFVELDPELYSQVAHPPARIIDAYNAPLIIQEYNLQLDVCNLKLEKIEWQQVKAIETNE